MKLVNLAHASLFFVGAYVGNEIQKQSGSLIYGILGAAIITVVVGYLLERFLLYRFHGKPLNLVLLTTGLMMVFEDIVLAIWPVPVRARAPAMFSRPVEFLGVRFPSYRLVVILIGIVFTVILWLIIERTKIGAKIRAGADNEEIAMSLGINIRQIFLITFSCAVLLAGAGGAIGSPVVALQPGTSMEFQTLALVVCMIGGLGSVKGVVFGSLFVGIVDSLGRALFPSFSYFTLFMPMAIVLILRPQGLFGRRLD